MKPTRLAARATWPPAPTVTPAASPKALRLPALAHAAPSHTSDARIVRGQAHITGL